MKASLFISILNHFTIFNNNEKDSNSLIPKTIILSKGKELDKEKSFV